LNRSPTKLPLLIQLAVLNFAVTVPPPGTNRGKEESGGMKRLIGVAALATLALSSTVGAAGADPATGITAPFVGMDAKDHAGYGYVVEAPVVHSGRACLGSAYDVVCFV
jgi:hypothetical protein